LSKSAQVIFHETGSSETRLDALRIKPVPDEIWNEAARHYDEQALAGLLLAISMDEIGRGAGVGQEGGGRAERHARVSQ